VVAAQFSFCNFCGHKFAADAFLEGGGIEGQPAADLRHLEGDATDAGGEGLVLEAIGVAEALLAALVGFCVEGAGAFAEHGLVDEDANDLGEAAGTLFGEELQDGVQEVLIF